MSRVYFDNAATTALDPEVLEAMMPYLTEFYGNPSSIHGHGSKVRAAVEQARKKVAALLNTSPSEIFFTSGGTESDNTAIRCAVHTLGLRHAITSPLEHHAVLHTLEHLTKENGLAMSLLRTDAQGQVDLEHLEQLLRSHPRTLVSLMHGNNEVGTLTNLVAVGEICHRYGAVFHSDTVQTVGHFPLDLQKLPVHSLVGAAHKFHGPKGVGFLYLRHDTKITPFITGGSQERNMRGGTENVYGIVGLAKALEIAYRDLEAHVAHIKGLKRHFMARLRELFGDTIRFNGASGQLDDSLYTVLNVNFPASEAGDMLLMQLDINQVSASGGSACSSGSNVGSHVLAALAPANPYLLDPARQSVRFSFSKYNTLAEVDATLEKLATIFQLQAV
ncbi:MAG: cysteine desulfurase [Bernardetiaceae bacterium]|jgi:cysteine desulfurase|nr:cysteine desulfurase [Bernardetiaceae bacterium]